jgi:hypothetical protein
MISPKLLEIASDFRKLSLAEQQWLLENLTKQVQNKTKSTGKFSNSYSLEKQLQELAQDSEIQKEVMAINQEFEMTEMDGLEN